MLKQFGFKAAELFNDPRARAIFIVSMLALAALAGGAPHDVGG